LDAILESKVLPEIDPGTAPFQKLRLSGHSGEPDIDNHGNHRYKRLEVASGPPIYAKEKGQL